jgi:thiamine kinase-like enzyme
MNKELMIRIPTNEELEHDLKDLTNNFDYKIKFRKLLDSNPFSILETIKFQHIEKEYVLKCLHPMMKNEIFVHRYANTKSINAAKLLNTSFDSIKPYHYILMEKIKFEPIYMFVGTESAKYFKTIAKKLADFHLESLNKVDEFKNYGLREYGISKYEKIIDNLGNRITKLSNTINHEYLLTTDLVDNFCNYIKDIRVLMDPVKNTKLTLVHGDFDTGNIIVNIDDSDVFAIDWGLAHIDVPVIDIAHMLSATEMSISTRRDIFEVYFNITNSLYPSMSMQDVRNAGKMMHIVYFLDWYLYSIEKDLVEAKYFFEQIHNRVQLITDLLTSPRN